MSGYKKVTVSISEEEYHRLLEAENRLRFQQSTQSKKRNQNVEKSIQQLYEQLREMEQRQSNFMRVVSHLDQSIQQVEAESAEHILDQAAAFMNDLEAYKEAFFESTQELVAQQGEFYQQAILQAHADRQQELMRVQRRVERLKRSDQQKRDFAEQWISTCDQVVQFIDANYPHHLIPGERLEQLVDELNLARQNLIDHILDGAVLGAQQVYQRLSRLRVSLEEVTQTYTALLNAADVALAGLDLQVRDARNYPAIDLDGNELEERIPVDLWTNGRLSMLLGEIESLRQKISNPAQPLTLERLYELIEQTIPEMNERLVRIIHEARKAALSSQLRVNIAEIVVNALLGQGFALIEGHYEGNEMQNPFAARLCALDGSQVDIRVVPSIDLTENELFLRNADAEERTDHELKIRAQEITRTLNAYGLRVQNLQTASPAPDEPAPAVRSSQPIHIVRTQISNQ